MNPLLKVLLGFLVISNIAFFAWHYSFEGAGKQTDDIPLPVQGAKPLVKLGETQTASESSAEQQQPPRQETRSEPENTEQEKSSQQKTVALDCFNLGPFADHAEAADLADVLADRGFNVRLRSGERELVRGYWVILPPFGNANDAFKAVQIMKSKGVKDVAVVGGDEYKNAVSLGLFSSRESAERRVKELSKQGYRPLIKERRDVEEGTWLIVDSSDKKALIAAIPVSFHNKYQGLTPNPAACQ